MKISSVNHKLMMKHLVFNIFLFFLLSGKFVFGMEQDISPAFKDEDLLATKDGREMLHWSQERKDTTLREISTENGFYEYSRRKVATLIAVGANVNTFSSRTQRTYLNTAVSKNDAPMVRFFLDHKADLNRGRPALFEAKDMRIVRLLVDAGASLGVRDIWYHETLLMQNDISFELFKYYLDCGVDIKAVTKYGENVLSRLASCFKTVQSPTDYDQLLAKTKLVLQRGVPLMIQRKHHPDYSSTVVEPARYILDIMDEEWEKEKQQGKATFQRLQNQEIEKQKDKYRELINAEKYRRINTITAPFVLFIEANNLAKNRLEGKQITLDWGLPIFLPNELLLHIFSYLKLYNQERYRTLMFPKVEKTSD